MALLCVLCITPRVVLEARWACNIKQWKDIALFHLCERAWRVSQGTRQMPPYWHGATSLRCWAVGWLSQLPCAGCLGTPMLLRQATACWRLSVLQSIMLCRRTVCSSSVQMPNWTFKCKLCLQPHLDFLKAVICIRGGRLRLALQEGWLWCPLYSFVWRIKSIKLIVTLA